MDKVNEQYTNGWQVLPDRVVLKTPIVTIRSGPVCSGRNGRLKDFYFFDFPDWVNVVAVTPARQIVLIRQFRYGTRRAELEIPGGMVNAGEDMVAAGCRELLEETGYAGSKARLIGTVCPNPAIQGNSCFTILVEEAVVVAAANQDEMEDISTILLAEEEVMSLIGKGGITHGLVLNALMFYRQLAAGTS